MRDHVNVLHVFKDQGGGCKFSFHTNTHRRGLLTHDTANTWSYWHPHLQVVYNRPIEVYFWARWEADTSHLKILLEGGRLFPFLT